MQGSYVALGDSYAAGVGAGERTGPCWRTDVGYPLVVARGLGVDLSWQACIAATIPDVRAQQIGALTPDTERVSVTVGGNDIGFAPVLVSAAQPAWMSDTDVVIDGALRLLREELPAQLDALYADIRQRAPRADVLVTTYPRLFNGDDCSLLTFFDTAEMRRLNEAAEELAACIRDAARRADVAVADVLDVFEGHAACDEQEWVNGVSWPVEESFHPSKPGHAAYARVVGAQWGVPAAPPEVEVGVDFGVMTAGSAPTFSVPDLLSMASLEGALDEGLDPALVARLARVAEVDPEARAQLRDLDQQVRARRRSRH